MAGISAILDHIWRSKGVRDKKPPKKGDFVDLNWYVKFSKLLMDETYHNYVSLRECKPCTSYSQSFSFSALFLGMFRLH